MKLKKILSSALLAVMIFTTLVAAIPFKANAAYTADSSQGASLTTNEIKAIAQGIYNYKFSSAEEMLYYELYMHDNAGDFVLDENGALQESGWLVSVSSDNYTLYVNRYTGVVYYRNMVTGQMLTSNPYDYSVIPGILDRQSLSSQVTVTLDEISTSDSHTLNSSTAAAERAQISTEYIKNGIRVHYTLGNTTVRYLLPGMIDATKLEEILLIPMFKEYIEVLETYCSEVKNSSVSNSYLSYLAENGEYFDFDLFGNEFYQQEDMTYSEGHLNKRFLKNYLRAANSVFESVNKTLPAEAIAKYNQIYSDLNTLYFATTSGYTLSETEDTKQSIYVFVSAEGNAGNTTKNNASIAFRRYVTDYSYTEMYEDEAACGYVDNTAKNPVFRCAIEYTLNEDDESLSVRLPANSISFDETYYNLNSITLLEAFGAGDITEDGYIFFPDGSGTIVEFDDFYDEEANVKENTAVAASVYGSDYCYSEITGAHREQVSMPVFGVVSTESTNAYTKLVGVNAETVTNGYFAILEEGASLAKILFKTGGSAHHYGSAYCSFEPYPSDKYDLSDTISVSGADSYTMVANTKFNGSYVTRYVMLTDENVAKAVSAKLGTEYKYYESSYVGMANYYRDFLYKNGVLTALTNIKENLPLYIETLGSMEITAKVLSFPVTKNIALTSFDNVLDIYNDLHDSADVLVEYYNNLAAQTTDETLKAEYLAMAADCQEFVMDNINFRLTGFGNGGLSNTYPTKLRWERACGGKKDFKNLLEAANDIAAKGENLGIYPDFDFMYLSYPEVFDGISKKNNISKMIDNRYASKQVYDSITRQYISYFSLVVSPESLEELYTKFAKKYAKYDITTISVATLGSDLNSNFDEDMSINRYDAEGYVSAVLDKMANGDGYEVMLDIGNAYTLGYASHLLNVCIDSSHFRQSSYPIPFIGMVLHGSVNYTGTPINYSGNPAYDMLRAIESGASLYYILCYQNASYMKEDPILSDYYGINYDSWYENIVLNYHELNNAIGGLQDYMIVDHKMIIGERIIDEDEQIANYKILIDEMVSLLDIQLAEAVDDAYNELLHSVANGGAYGTPVVVKVDKDALMEQFVDILQLSDEDTEIYDELSVKVDAVIAKYEAEYPDTAAQEKKLVEFDELIYEGEELLNKALELLDEQLADAYAEAVEKVALLNSDEAKKKTYVLNFKVDRAAILSAVAEAYKIDADSLDDVAVSDSTFGEMLDAVIAKYEALNKAESELADDEKHETVTFNAIEDLYNYASKYSFITDSCALDENYVYTDYTSDSGNIALVTYQKVLEDNTVKTVQFILNYNIYSVTVDLGDGNVYELGKYEYIRIG